MSTLGVNIPIQALAEIIRAAQLLSPGAWGDSGGKPAEFNPSTASEAELSHDLLELFTALNTRQISYLLVGGVALLKYVDGRNTQDIDLLLSVTSLDQIPEIVIADQNRDFARGRFRSLRVDLLFTENPLFQIVQDRYATHHRFREVDVRAATPQGLLLLKMYALPSLYRQGNGQRIALYEADLTMLLQRHPTPMEPLLQVLRPFVDSDAMIELRNISADIEARIARINRLRSQTPTGD